MGQLDDYMGFVKKKIDEPIKAKRGDYTIEISKDKLTVSKPFSVYANGDKVSVNVCHTVIVKGELHLTEAVDAAIIELDKQIKVAEASSRASYGQTLRSGRGAVWQ
jgi:lysyl-tRNA synthetase class II